MKSDDIDVLIGELYHACVLLGQYEEHEAYHAVALADCVAKRKDLHGRVTELRERAEGAKERAERWHSRFKSELSRSEKAEAREQKATDRERNLEEALLIAESKLMRVRECLKTLNRDGYRAAVRVVLDAMGDG